MGNAFLWLEQPRSPLPLGCWLWGPHMLSVAWQTTWQKGELVRTFLYNYYTSIETYTNNEFLQVGL